VKLRDDLTAWLKAIRDGAAEPDVLAKAQEALRTLEALPEDVRLSGLQDDPQAGAAALLSLFGLDDTFSALLRSAVAIESGEPELAHEIGEQIGDPWQPMAQALRIESSLVGGVVDLADKVLQGCGLEMDDLPIAEAVRSEAGEVDIAEAVMFSLSLDKACEEVFEAELGDMLRDGLEEAAGPAPDLWGSISQAIGIEDPEAIAGYDGALVAEAVRAEAGALPAAFTDHVMTALAVSAIAPHPGLPQPANRRWLWAVAAAAVAGIMGWSSQFNPLESPIVDTPEVLTFASANEIVVDDLFYAENAMVQVFQTGADDGALIIWIDEEVVL